MRAARHVQAPPRIHPMRKCSCRLSRLRDISFVFCYITYTLHT